MPNRGLVQFDSASQSQLLPGKNQDQLPRQLGYVENSGSIPWGVAIFLW